MLGKTTLQSSIKILLIIALTALAGTVAFSNTLIGGFAGSVNKERIEQVAGLVAPVWEDVIGMNVEVVFTLTQTAVGEATAVIRLLDEKRPLTLVFHSTAGFQLVPPGGLLENTPANPSQGGPQTCTIKLRVHHLKSAVQTIVLSELQPDGKFLPMLIKTMALRDTLRPWVEAGGELTVGLAGPIKISDADVKIFREGTLLLVR